LQSLISDEKPDAIVHFAEQRSAPYSMKSAAHARYTVNVNLNATYDICAAVAECGKDIHIIHLGSIGVYGYVTSGIRIPEGYLDVLVRTARGEKELSILYPAEPGSVYHLTKAQDQIFFQFFNQHNRIRITDLHQGIVWGTQTEQTRMDERLINRFDYDGDYGTVLNRFLMQAAVDYPLTVYGTGRQTRAFVHIEDCVRCVQLALENPPLPGERVRIMNQATETRRIVDLAHMIAKMSGASVIHFPNPRNEAEENELEITTSSLLDLGLKPTALDVGPLREVGEIAKKYRSRADLERIPCVSNWNAPTRRSAPPLAMAGSDTVD